MDGLVRSKEMEKNRRQAEILVQEHGSNATRVSCGKISSNYDPRSGASTITIRFGIARCCCFTYGLLTGTARHCRAGRGRQSLANASRSNLSNDPSFGTLSPRNCSIAARTSPSRKPR